MATPTAPVYDYSHAEPSLADYTSIMLKMYFENLGHSSKAQVLDVGTVIHSFIIKDGYQIKFRYQDHLDLPRYYHSNRIMTAILS